MNTNQQLTNIFYAVGLELVDIKLEFGKTFEGSIVLGNELSPDICRIRDSAGTSLDKDRFRKNLGDVIEGYQAVLDLLTSEEIRE